MIPMIERMFHIGKGLMPCPWVVELAASGPSATKHGRPPRRLIRTMGGNTTIARLVIERLVLMALALGLILGLYPALLHAIAPVAP